MRVHYPNLNSLRFIAASLVMVSHLEEVRTCAGLTSHHPTGVIFNSGSIGVCLFFALSGFLITSLLIKEKHTYGRVAIKKFYIRRILRIWPVYFIVGILALFIIPHIPFLYLKDFGIDPNDKLALNALLFLFFLPNLQKLLVGGVPYAMQTWSIGVEEQYYLFWPLIVSKIKRLRHLRNAIILMIAGYLAFKLFLLISVPRILHGHFWVYMLHFFKRYFQVDCLLIGSLCAIINLSKVKKYITNKYAQYLIYAVFLVVYLTNGKYAGFDWEVYTALFGLMIINMVNKTSLINLEYKWLSYLGKISYGLYMYHYMVAGIVVKSGVTNVYMIYLLTFSGAILVATLSYEFIEKRFLRLKSKYALLKTG